MSGSPKCRVRCISSKMIVVALMVVLIAFCVIFLLLATFLYCCGRNNTVSPGRVEVRQPRLTDSCGLRRMVLNQHETNVFLLPSDSGPIEEIFPTGIWLVYFGAVWSIPDQKGFHVASAVADSFEGKIGVAAYKFGDYREIERLYSAITIGNRPPPVWVLMRNGTVLGEIRGCYDFEAVLSFLRNHCRDPSTLDNRTEEVAHPAKEREKSNE